MLLAGRGVLRPFTTSAVVTALRYEDRLTVFGMVGKVIGFGYYFTAPFIGGAMAICMPLVGILPGALYLNAAYEIFGRYEGIDKMREILYKIDPYKPDYHDLRAYIIDTRRPAISDRLIRVLRLEKTLGVEEFYNRYTRHLPTDFTVSDLINYIPPEDYKLAKPSYTF